MNRIPAIIQHEVMKFVPLPLREDSMSAELVPPLVAALEGNLSVVQATGAGLILVREFVQVLRDENHGFFKREVDSNRRFPVEYGVQSGDAWGFG